MSSPVDYQDRPPAPASPLADRLAVAAFALVLLAPIADRWLEIDPVTARQPMNADGTHPTAPSVTEPEGDDIRGRIGALREHAAQNFGLRDSLVLADGLIQVDLLRGAGSDEVLVADHDWLFLRSEGVLDLHRNLRPLSPSALEALTATLEAQRRWLGARGVPYLLVVVPSKHSVYAEELPHWARPLRSESRLDQLAAALSRRTRVELLDLRAALFAGRQTEQLYHRSDTHWNAAGAYVGYRAILEALAGRLGINALDRRNFQLSHDDAFSGDLARMLGLGGWRRETAPLLAPIVDTAVVTHSGEAAFAHLPRYLEPFATTSAALRSSGAPSALIFRDSFGDALFPFLAQHFATARFAWSDSFAIEARLDPLVAASRPDVVIQVIAERALARIGSGGGAATPLADSQRAGNHSR